MLNVMATLPPGLEEEACRELRGFNVKVQEVRGLRGRIFFECPEPEVVKLNYRSRCLERVVVVLLRCEVEGLEEIYRRVRGLEFSRWISSGQSFAIRASRIGSHPYTSMDIAREAGRAVIDSYLSSKGVRLKVNLDEPDVIVRVYQVKNELVVGIDTTGDWALHKRGYRVYDHPAALNPCIASAMIIASNWKPGDSLIDPMCGGGTIPIEAALKGLNIPPAKFRRKPLAISNLRVFQVYLEALSAEGLHSDSLMLDIWGLDISPKHVAGAVQNSKAAGVDKVVKFLVGDATRLRRIFDRGFDFAIVNPPYGLRSSSPRALRKLYNGLASSMVRLLEKRLVTITHRVGTMREALLSNGFEIEFEKPVKHGDLPCWVLSARPP